jgi:hypothetical protein
MMTHDPAGRPRSSQRSAWIWLTAAAILVVVHRAAAQGVPDGHARFQLGPLNLTPTIAIKDVGVDTNVFNEQTNPKDDFTATVSPALQTAIHLGPLRVAGATSFGFVYYERYRDQQSVDHRHEGRIELLTSRVRPFVSAGLDRTRARQGPEIDARAWRTATLLRAGTDIEMGAATALIVSMRRSRSAFDAGESFNGVDLGQQLNHASEGVDLVLRSSLTALTAFAVRLEAERARFDESQVRDADTYAVMTGFEFEPDALVRGSAYVGYRRFLTRSSTLPDFTGAIASASVGAVAFGTTAFDVQVARDVGFSFQPTTPYHVSTLVALTITQRLVGPFDVRAGGSRQRLDYRAIEGTSLDGPAVDLLDSLTAGVGFRVAETGRFAIDVRYTERRPTASLTTAYDALRVMASFTYGFK